MSIFKGRSPPRRRPRRRRRCDRPEIVADARSKGVVLNLKPDGQLTARGPRRAIDEIKSIVKGNRPAILAVLQERHDIFSFAPTDEPENDREAIEERAAIIVAEGTGIGPAQALQEALWQAEREQCWRRFLRHATEIMQASPDERPRLLDLYHRDAAAAFGEPMARFMTTTMRRWIAAHSMGS